MLASQSRLKKDREIKAVLSKGRVLKEDSLMLKLLANGLDYNKFGFSISLKVSKKAVARNKIKRLLSEAARLKAPALKKGFNLFFLVQPGLALKNVKEINQIMDRLLSKAGLLN